MVAQSLAPVPEHPKKILGEVQTTVRDGNVVVEVAEISRGGKSHVQLVLSAERAIRLATRLRDLGTQILAAERQQRRSRSGATSRAA
jgi:hypothetical protein